VSKAIEEDTKQNYAEAYKQYQNSLDYFMMVRGSPPLLFFLGGFGWFVSFVPGALAFSFSRGQRSSVALRRPWLGFVTDAVLGWVSSWQVGFEGGQSFALVLLTKQGRAVWLGK
jgi:hypothetical protein